MTKEEDAYATCSCSGGNRKAKVYLELNLIKNVGDKKMGLCMYINERKIMWVCH